MVILTFPDTRRLEKGFIDPWNNRILLKYFSDLYGYHGYIRFLGLDLLDDKQKDVPSSELFVAPRLSRQAIDPAQDESQWPENSDLLEVLVNTPCLIVLGDPGSGKSTLVDWLSVVFTRAENNLYQQRLNQLVPLPFVLRELDLSQVTDWDSLLQALLQQRKAEALRKSPDGIQCVQQLLDTGQALLLFDGVDEISQPQTRKHLGSAIREGLQRYPQCRALLTSRVVGFNQHEFFDLPTAQNELQRAIAGEYSGQFLPEYTVCPFNDSQMRQLVDNWYVHNESNPKVRQDKAADLLAAIRANPGIRVLARRPNLLTMIALIHRHKAELPNGRVKLYDAIANAYLHAIDHFRRLKGAVSYELEDQRRWLGQVAFTMQTQRGEKDGNTGVLISKAQVHDILAEAMADSGLDDAPRKAAEYLEHVGRRSGLLIPRSEQLYGFAHLSFQEYFAATHVRHLATRPKEDAGLTDQLRNWAADSAWQETLVLMFEQLPDSEWGDALVERVFGEPPSVKAKGVRLAASLAMDGYVRLSRPVRNTLLESCWGWQLNAEYSEIDQAQIAPILWNENNPSHADSLKALRSVCAATTTIYLILKNSLLSDVSPIAQLPNTQKIAHLNLRNTRINTLAPLAGLSNLTSLYISVTPIIDFTPLAELTNMESLSLSRTKIDDLAPLSLLIKLKWLLLSCTPVDNLTPLTGLSQLQTLHLIDTPISDLKPLSTLTNLEELYLNGTHVTDLTPLLPLRKLKQLTLDADLKSHPSVAALQAALPELNIEWT